MLHNSDWSVVLLVLTAKGIQPSSLFTEKVGVISGSIQISFSDSTNPHCVSIESLTIYFPDSVN